MVTQGDGYHLATIWAKISAESARRGPEAEHSESAGCPQPTTRRVPAQRRNFGPFAALYRVGWGVLTRHVQMGDALSLGAYGIDQENITLIAGLSIDGCEEPRAAVEHRAGDGGGVATAGNAHECFPVIGRDQQGASAFGQRQGIAGGREQWCG